MFFFFIFVIHLATKCCLIKINTASALLFRNIAEAKSMRNNEYSVALCL